MRLVRVGALLLGLTLSVPEASADPPPTTIWMFHASYPSGQYIESTDPSVAGPILMYTGATWRCRREALSLGASGRLGAGFTCSNGATFVNIIAGCHGSETSDDRAQAGVGDGNGYVNLSVRCSTIAKPKASGPKSADKSL